MNNIKKNTLYLIAEISANHCGNFEKAKKLISLAKQKGFDAVKLQTYTPDTMTINSDNKNFKIKKGIWKGKKLWNLYHEAQTPYAWHENLFKFAKKKKITCFSTPFDETAIKLLEHLNCPFYKVASHEITDLPLIKKIAKTKKKIIISTGMANLNEINDAYFTAKNNGASEVILLYCVSSYPADKNHFNLNNIKILKEKFKCRVGFSDHSNENIIASSAVSAGAEIIEKHIAFSNLDKSLDINFSIKKNEIDTFVKQLRLTYSLLGKKIFFRNNLELKNRIYRRSIYDTKDILKGEKLSKKNLKILRPANGIEPKYFTKLINKKCPFKINKNSPIKKKLLQELNIK